MITKAINSMESSRAGKILLPYLFLSLILRAGDFECIISVTRLPSHDLSAFIYTAEQEAAWKKQMEAEFIYDLEGIQKLIQGTMKELWQRDRTIVDQESNIIGKIETTIAHVKKIIVKGQTSPHAQQLTTQAENVFLQGLVMIPFALLLKSMSSIDMIDERIRLVQRAQFMMTRYRTAFCQKVCLYEERNGLIIINLAGLLIEMLAAQLEEIYESHALPPAKFSENFEQSVPPTPEQHTEPAHSQAAETVTETAYKALTLYYQRNGKRYPELTATSPVPLILGYNEEFSALRIDIERIVRRTMFFWQPDKWINDSTVEQQLAEAVTKIVSSAYALFKNNLKA